MKNEREKLLFLYSSALERGDMETLAAILNRAAHDPVLGAMIEELNAAYTSEKPALNGHHRETMPMIKKQPRVNYNGLTLMVAAVATLILCSLLLFLPSSFNGVTIPQMQPPVFDVPITPDNAGQLEKIAELGAGSLYDTQLSPDGQTLAVATTYGIFLHSVTDGTKQPFGSYRGRVATIAYSPDGSLLVGSIGSKLTMWDVATQAVVKEFEGDFAQFMTYSPDGRTILTATCAEPANPYGICAQQEVVLLDVESGETTPVREAGDDLYMQSSVFSPDGSLFAFSYYTSGTTAIEVWRTADAASVITLNGQSSAGLAFSPDYRYLAAAGNEVTVWDIETGETVKKITPNTQFTESVAFSSDGKSILYLDRDVSQRLALQAWNLETKRLDNSMIFPEEEIVITGGFEISQDRQKLMTYTHVTPVQVWDIQNKPELILTLDEYKNNSNELMAFENSLLVGGWFDLDLWNIEDQQPVTTLMAGQFTLNTFDSKGKLAYLQHLDDVMIYRQRLMYWQEGEVRETDITFDQANAMIFDEQDELLVFTRTMEETNRFLVVRVKDDQEISRVELQIPFTLYSGVNYDIANITSAFSPDGRLLVTGLCFAPVKPCEKPALLVYDTRSGEVLGTLDVVHGNTFSTPLLAVGVQDGRYQVAAAGCLEEQARCVTSWDITPLLEGQPAVVLFSQEIEKVDDFGVNSLKFSPDMQMLVTTASTMGEVLLYDAQTGDLITTLSGGYFPMDATFNGDMTRLVTLDDGVITLWGVRR